jgi:hypothetical protein
VFPFHSHCNGAVAELHLPIASATSLQMLFCSRPNAVGQGRVWNFDVRQPGVVGRIRRSVCLGVALPGQREARALADLGRDRE